jgi:BMFP domain-containing protein YqiC
MPTELRELEITRVDLVDQGANFDPATGDGSHVLLFKRAPTKPEDEPEKRGPDMAKEKEGAFDPSGLPEDAQAYVAEIQKQADAATETANGLTEELEALKTQVAELEAAKPPEEPPTDEEVLKSLDPAVRERFEAVQKTADEAVEKAAAAQKRADELEDARKSEQFAKMAVTELPTIGTEGTGQVLKAAHAALDKEQADELMAMLRSADELARQGKVFKEIGTGGADALGDAQEIVQKKAEKMVADGQAPTVEQAYAKVLETDRELAIRVDEETRQQN